MSYKDYIVNKFVRYLYICLLTILRNLNGMNTGQITYHTNPASPKSYVDQRLPLRTNFTLVIPVNSGQL